jgi:hypothetical protein
MVLNRRTLVPIGAATILLLTMAVFMALPVGGTTASPKPDGVATAVCGPCSSVTLSLTTSNPNDVIIVYQAQGGNCVTPNLPTDTAGMTYSLREDAKYCNNMEGIESYSIANSPLSGDTITCSAQGQTWISCTAFGVSGGNTKNPFDGQPVAASTALGYQPGSRCPTSNGAIYPCVYQMSTTKPNDFVFIMGTDNGENLPLQTAGHSGGLALLASTNPSVQDGYVEWTEPSGLLTNQVEPFGVPIGIGFIVIGDAIQAATLDSGTSTPSSTSSTTSSSATVSSDTLVTSTCTVTFTESSGNVMGWSGAC